MVKHDPVLGNETLEYPVLTITIHMAKNRYEGLSVIKRA
jgi:hypothetical protein